MHRYSLLPEHVRAHNRGLLLRLLTEHGAQSRRDLARHTGLSIPTVTSIVADLAADGYVTEALQQGRTGRRGPRATLVGLARDGHRVIGVEIGACRVRIGLCDLSGLLVDVVEAPFDPAAAADEVLDLAVAAAAPLVTAAGRGLLGIGVAVPGPVDTARRHCVLALALGWRDVAVADRFEEAFGKATVVEYNVLAMALAEARHGLGQQAENMLYVQLGDGVGFAFLVDGNAFRQGAHGVSELGHYQVADAPACVCGAKGCLDAVLREPNLRARVRQAARRSRVLARAAVHNPAPLDALDAAAQAGDKAAAGLLTEFAEHLSTGIALNVNIFSPTRVALGGILAHAPKDLLEEVSEATRRKVCAVLRERVQIEPSAITRYPEVLGAATVALDQVFYASSPIPTR